MHFHRVLEQETLPALLSAQHPGMTLEHFCSQLNQNELRTLW